MEKHAFKCYKSVLICWKILKDCNFELWCTYVYVPSSYIQIYETERKYTKEGKHKTGKFRTDWKSHTFFPAIVVSVQVSENMNVDGPIPKCIYLNYNDGSITPTIHSLLFYLAN